MTGRFAGRVVTVAGFGSSGRAAAAVLLEEGATVRVTEARHLQEISAPPVDPEGIPGPDELDVELLTGGHRPEHLDGASLLVVSPGIPEHALVIQWAHRRGIPVWSELELGARLCRAPYVAVTGTNGKTTTVDLLASMMRSAGLSARACGNVGYPFCLAARQGLDALAVEASSFQLRFHSSFHPRVSVLLNLAPDHLDWHRSFRAYASAKARIFARQGTGDVHVGNRDDAEAAVISSTAPCPVRWFGWGRSRPGEVEIVDGSLAVRLDDNGARSDLGAPAAPGRTLLLDAAAAATAALAFGIPPDAIRSGLSMFVPLPHRGALVAQKGAVTFVDDSKATNPHAALAALEGRSGVVLIAGGLAKGVDLSPLAAAAPSLAAVVAIGESAPVVAAVFEGLTPVRMARSIEEAVEVAYREARPDGAVVLAPACASQDMFRDYRERGARFAAAARELAARGEPIYQSGRSHA